MFGSGFFLTTEFMDLATESYLQGHDPTDPRVSVMFAEIPAGVAPALVATAGFDPLRDEGEDYARRLREAGVEVDLKRYGPEIHGFVNILAVEGTTKVAVREMAGKLRAALA